MSDSTPSQPSFVFAHDEDILVHAGADYALLVNSWDQLAAAKDGVFASGQPWILTSATVDFEAQGVGPNNVVQLLEPKGVYGSAGHFLAVDSVDGNSVTLRRPYKPLGVGQPPAPSSGLTSVSFNICTFAAVIAEASYDLYQRFSIDNNVATQGIQRSTSWMYDPQVMRIPTVYAALLERYTNNARTNKGDFDNKVARYEQKLSDAIGRIQIRWGPTGNSAESTALFSCKLSR